MRKDHNFARRVLIANVASMGPQHDSCGRFARARQVRAVEELQWGRNMIVAEGLLACQFSGIPAPASMGPQHDSCGRSRDGRNRRGRNTASMGPQHDSCGREVRRDLAKLGTLASMGPQHDSCGRTKSAAAPVGQAPASMGPQHDSCGRCLAFLRCGLSSRASMGPQHDSCGRAGADMASMLALGLQWGRNMIVAEGLIARLFPS